jgi:hypothetical protein
MAFAREMVLGRMSLFARKGGIGGYPWAAFEAGRDIGVGVAFRARSGIGYEGYWGVRARWGWGGW